MHRKKLRLKKRIMRTNKLIDLQSFKQFLKLYKCRLRNLKRSFFSKKLTELDTYPKELQKTINLF